MKSSWTATVVWASFAASVLAAHGATVHYTVTDLGPVGPVGTGTTSASALNDSNQVIGTATVAGGQSHACRWQPGAAGQDLGALNSAAYYSSGSALNASGVMVGMSQTQAGGYASPFRSAGGAALEELPRLSGGGDAIANGINASGVIVGWSNRGIGCGGPACTGNPGYAVRWVGSTIQTVGNLGGFYSVATGLNDAGEICGYGAPRTNNAVTHAFRLAVGGSSADDAGTLGGANSWAYAINRSGQMVGASELPGTTSTHAVLWNGTTPEDLGVVPGTTQSGALGVNDADLVVGWSGGSAALFARGVPPVDLNTLIATNSGWRLTSTRAINAFGLIVAQGELNSNGVNRAVLLTPVNPRLFGSRQGAGFNLSWSSQSNWTYQVQYTTDLAARKWGSVGTGVPGDGRVRSATDFPRTAPGGVFYRLACTGQP